MEQNKTRYLVRFRAFNRDDKTLYTWDMYEGYPLKGINAKAPQEYTGVCDKNLKDVYVGDIVNHNGQNYLYATLCGARQIKDSEIQEFRSKLIGSVDSLFQHSPGHQHSDLLKRGYERCFALNNILGQGNNGAFVVNVHYQELKLHFKDDTNLNHPIGMPTDYRGLMANVRGNLEVPCK